MFSRCEVGLQTGAVSLTWSQKFFFLIQKKVPPLLLVLRDEKRQQTCSLLKRLGYAHPHTILRTNYGNGTAREHPAFSALERWTRRFLVEISLDALFGLLLYLYQTCTKTSPLLRLLCLHSSPQIRVLHIPLSEFISLSAQVTLYTQHWFSAPCFAYLSTALNRSHEDSSFSQLF